MSDFWRRARSFRRALSRRIGSSRLAATVRLVAGSLLIGIGLGWLLRTYFFQPTAIQDAIAGVVNIGLGLGTCIGPVVATVWRRQPETSTPAEASGADSTLSRDLPRLDSLPRVGECGGDAPALGVHKARPLRAGPDTEPNTLPRYVSRYVEPEFTEWMRTASNSGGFLLVVGDSYVGKTRLLYEMANRELTDFGVFVPGEYDGAVVNALAERLKRAADRGRRLPKLVIWLDELQLYLAGPYLRPGACTMSRKSLRLLMDLPTPVVVLATLRPQHVAQLRAVERRLANEGGHYRYPEAGDLLDGDHRLHEITLHPFDTDERARVSELGEVDTAWPRRSTIPTSMSPSSWRRHRS